MFNSMITFRPPAFMISCTTFPHLSSSDPSHRNTCLHYFDSITPRINGFGDMEFLKRDYLPFGRESVA